MVPRDRSQGPNCRQAGLLKAVEGREARSERAICGVNCFNRCAPESRSTSAVPRKQLKYESPAFVAPRVRCGAGAARAMCPNAMTPKAILEFGLAEESANQGALAILAVAADPVGCRQRLDDEFDTPFQRPAKFANQEYYRSQRSGQPVFGATTAANSLVLVRMNSMKARKGPGT